MTGFVDVAKIQARKAELEAELSKLDQFLALLENFSKPVPVPLPPAQHYQAFAVPAPRVEHVRGFTPGLRRAVTMALYTGPLTMEELAKALAWDMARTKTVVGSMLKFKVAFLSEHGRLTLAEEGKAQADWFIKNPGKLVYSPGNVRK
jgi:hypothetical protein